MTPQDPPEFSAAQTLPCGVRQHGAASGQPTPPATRGTTPPHGGQTAVVDSASLLRGQRELLIQHQGQCYRLQATRQGKLILTK